MLVDDEDLDIEGLKRLIKWNELGIEISGTANNAYKALEFLNTNSVDLLVSDIKMPIMSGLELFEKAKEKNTSLKAIFISGYQDFQYAKKAIQMSASGYVLKPIDYGELTVLIKRVTALIYTEKRNKKLISELEEARKVINDEWKGRYEQNKTGGESLKVKGQNIKLINDIEKYVEKHLDEKLTLKNVANHFAFTPNYLGSLFKEETDKYFTDFLVQKKLERACKLLKDTNMKIYEIADNLGYSNMNYFSKQFKEHYGISPLDYKKKVE
jgi:two-component system, response regulator YesN